MINLNQLVADATDWSLLITATAISNTGFITGYGITASGETHAFVLTPTETAWDGNTSSSGGGSTEGAGGSGSSGEPTSQVPAPPTLILIGVTGFLLRRSVLHDPGVRNASKHNTHKVTALGSWH